MTASPASMWTNYEQAYSDAVSRQLYQRASNIMKEALHKAKASGTYDQLLVMRADELAKVSLEKGELTHAASLYRLLFEMKKCELGMQHPDVTTTQQNLVAVLSMNGGMVPQNPRPTTRPRTN